MAAFWTYGDHWATNGEIDIMEAKVANAGIPTEYQTNYFYGDQEGYAYLLTDPATAAFRVTGVNLMDANYHVFMLEWTEAQLKFYFDNVLVDTRDPSTNIRDAYVPDLWDKTQHIVLNLAYGGDFVTSANPAFVPGPITDGIMEVDWVKVFVKLLP